MPDTTQKTLFETAPTNGHPTPPYAEAEERPGYQFVKRIGWIPDDWQETAIGRHVDLLTGFAFKSDGFSDDGIRLVRGSNVSKGYLRWKPSITMHWPECTEKLKRYLLKADDVLVGMDGALVGRNYAVVTKSDLPLLLVQRVARLRVKDSVDHRFAFYLFRDNGFSRYVDAVKTGTGIPHISPHDIRKFPIPLPPLPEQREIARVLGAWGRALADLDALLDAKRQRARGLAQRLLTGRARLPGFGDAETVETSIGPVPSDWRAVRFGKVFAKRSEKNVGSAIDHVITVGKYAIRPQSEHFDKSVASADRSGYNVIHPGDFVYDPMSAYYGAIGRYDDDQPGIVSPVYRVLTLRRGFDSGFVKHLLDAHYVRHRIASYSTQGNKEGKRRGLQHDAFNAIPVYVPSEDEQRRVAAVLDAAGAELAALDDQRAALAEQKRGLMQRLLTGEVRVTPPGSLQQAH